MYTADIQKIKRQFIPTDFVVTDWPNLEPFFKDLLERNIDTKESLEQWLLDQSELEAVVSEDACWRQIKMTCDTENKVLEEAFNLGLTTIIIDDVGAKRYDYLIDNKMCFFSQNLLDLIENIDR